ncbi:DivIVA domain-containing protein [Pedococcus sp. 5OH_020]|uniref:DivIVA domain-containing protein n=1 Tax=Pedococcus sp. 5OH_020 TaxID=2989814 RepID=UPI0022EA0AE5|nr:DivIVA domain-containing protein [Pedococcus sp. 5OH_020]
MIWVLFIVMAVLLVGAFAAMLVGRVGYDPMAAATTTQSDPVLPEDFTADEISAIRFDTALRGYRMDQVDAVLDRLQARILELEAGGGQRR